MEHCKTSTTTHREVSTTGFFVVYNLNYGEHEKSSEYKAHFTSMLRNELNYKYQMFR